MKKVGEMFDARDAMRARIVSGSVTNGCKGPHLDIVTFWWFPFFKVPLASTTMLNIV